MREGPDAQLASIVAEALWRSLPNEAVSLRADEESFFLAESHLFDKETWRIKEAIRVEN